MPLRRVWCSSGLVCWWERRGQGTLSAGHCLLCPSSGVILQNSCEIVGERHCETAGGATPCTGVAMLKSFGTRQFPLQQCEHSSGSAIRAEPGGCIFLLVVHLLAAPLWRGRAGWALGFFELIWLGNTTLVETISRRAVSRSAVIRCRSTS